MENPQIRRPCWAPAKPAGTRPPLGAADAKASSASERKNAGNDEATGNSFASWECQDEAWNRAVFASFFLNVYDIVGGEGWLMLLLNQILLMNFITKMDDDTVSYVLGHWSRNVTNHVECM